MCGKDIHQNAFEDLKLKLMTAPILTFFNPKYKTVLKADASGYALGVVLSQIELDEQGKELIRPIAYYSRVFSQAERNYHTTERECLAILVGCLKFYCYLHARHFLIETDHCAIKYLKTIRLRHGRLSRWAVLLQDLQFDIKHIKGVFHSEAYCLSRLPNLKRDLKIDKRDDAMEPLPRFIQEYDLNALQVRSLNQESEISHNASFGIQRDKLRQEQSTDSYCISVRTMMKGRELSNPDAMVIFGFVEIDEMLSEGYQN